MNLKVLLIFLLYYSAISLMFISQGSILIDNDFNTTVNINDSTITEDEQDTGGLFSVGVSFSRFLGFTFFGIGLPDDTPSWFSTIFIIWQSLFTVFAIAWFISSLWNG